MTHIANTGYLTNNKKELIHRLIVKDEIDKISKEFPNETIVVHHKDGNRLNNDKDNLIVMPLRNHMSEHNKNKGLFGFTGNQLNKSKNPEKRCWGCRIRYFNKQKRLGLFEDPLSCQIVYNLVHEELYVRIL